MSVGKHWKKTSYKAAPATPVHKTDCKNNYILKMWVQLGLALYITVLLVFGKHILYQMQYNKCTVLR